MTDRSADHPAAIDLAKNIDRFAREELDAIDNKMRGRQFPPELRRILWATIARKACVLANKASGECG